MLVSPLVFFPLIMKTLLLALSGGQINRMAVLVGPPLQDSAFLGVFPLTVCQSSHSDVKTSHGVTPMANL